MSNRWKRGAQFILLLVFAIYCQAAISQQRPDSNLLVLTGATVIDGLGGSPIPEAVVLVEGDKIKAVGAKGTSYPSGATVVELSGKVIIPGLIDSHTHYEEWMGEMFSQPRRNVHLRGGRRLGPGEGTLPAERRKNAEDLRLGRGPAACAFDDAGAGPPLRAAMAAEETGFCDAGLVQ